MQEAFDLGWYHFKWRMHSPEIGRFMALDPLAEKYFYNSPYAFSENRLTDGVEMEGLEFYKFTSLEVGLSLHRLVYENQYIRQGETNLCGPAAIANVWMQRDMKGFLNTFYDLWVFGKANYNGVELNPNIGLQITDPHRPIYNGPVPQYPFEGGAIKNSAIDFIINSSIMANEYSSYNGRRTNLTGMSLKDVQNAMSDLLGLKDVQRLEYYGSKDAKSVLSAIDRRYKNGYSEILYYNAMLEGGEDTKHFTNYAGEYSTYNLNGVQYFQFDVISFGTTKTINASENEINQYLEQSIYGR